MNKSPILSPVSALTECCVTKTHPETGDRVRPEVCLPVDVGCKGAIQARQKRVTIEIEKEKEFPSSRYSSRAGRHTTETKQMHVLFVWLVCYIEFTEDNSTAPFGEIYSRYVEFMDYNREVGVKPLTRQSVGLLLPAFGWLMGGFEIRKLLKNKTVLYEGVRWRENTYCMTKA